LVAPGISKRNIKYYDVPIDDPQSASAGRQVRVRSLIGKDA
jgi:hypothetical protein